MTTTLLLLRHAHTEANEHGSTPRMAGWCDIPLSERGEIQLDALRRVSLGELAPLVYSSTSPRAMCTAAAVARGRSVVPLRSLREIACGDVDGWLITDVARRHPDLWRRNLAQDDPDFCWPGGESYRSLRARVLRALRGISARHRGARVLVVTHAGPVAQVVGHIEGVSPARWECYRPANASITTVACDDDGTMRLLELDRRIVPDVTLAADAGRRGG